MKTTDRKSAGSFVSFLVFAACRLRGRNSMNDPFLVLTSLPYRVPAG